MTHVTEQQNLHTRRVRVSNYSNTAAMSVDFIPIRNRKQILLFLREKGRKKHKDEESIDLNWACLFVKI